MKEEVCRSRRLRSWKALTRELCRIQFRALPNTPPAPSNPSSLRERGNSLGAQASLPACYSHYSSVGRQGCLRSHATYLPNQPMGLPDKSTHTLFVCV